MLPRPYRLPLTNTQQFSGTKKHSTHFTVVSAPNVSPHSRAAIIIPKKIIAAATGRNRLKRQINTALFPLLSTPPYRDILILPRQTAAALPPTDLQQELVNLLHV